MEYICQCRMWQYLPCLNRPANWTKNKKQIDAKELPKYQRQTVWMQQTTPIKTGWWFQIFFYFHPYWGKRFPILTNIFQMGWFNHQLDQLQFESGSIERRQGRTRKVVHLKYGNWEVSLEIWKGHFYLRHFQGDGQWFSLNPWMEFGFFFSKFKVWLLLKREWFRDSTPHIEIHLYSLVIYIWMFPKIEVPPNHPF